MAAEEDVAAAAAAEGSVRIAIAGPAEREHTLDLSPRRDLWLILVGEILSQRYGKGNRSGLG